MGIRILAMTALALVAIGCNAVPPDISVGHDPIFVTLSETAEVLNLRVEHTEFWGQRHLYDDKGNRVLIEKETAIYYFNGLRRKVEYPGVKFDGTEFTFPLGMYNSLCKDFGRYDALRDETPRHKRDPRALEPLPGSVHAQPSKGRTVDGTALAGMTIVVDPGHGGKDPGAIGVDGTYEATIALAVAARLKKELNARGARVIMTRTTSKGFMKPGERAGFANAKKADLFISVHANSHTTKKPQGIETYYHAAGTRGKASKSLAQKVNDSLVDSTKATDRGAKAANYQVIKYTTMPAILVEVGFISNQAELTNLKDGEYQQKLARAIAEGICLHTTGDALVQR